MESHHELVKDNRHMTRLTEIPKKSTPKRKTLNLEPYTSTLNRTLRPGGESPSSNPMPAALGDTKFLRVEAARLS